MNTVNLIARLTHDPETKILPNTILCEMSVAYSKKYKDKEKVSFFQVKVFGNSAQACGDFLKKGSQIGISGELEQERWDTPDGKKGQKVIINAFKIDFLSKSEKPGQPDTTAQSPEDIF